MLVTLISNLLIYILNVKGRFYTCMSIMWLENMKLFTHMYLYLFELKWPLKIIEDLTSFVKNLCNTCHLISNDCYFCLQTWKQYLLFKNTIANKWAKMLLCTKLFIHTWLVLMLNKTLLCIIWFPLYI